MSDSMSDGDSCSYSCYRGDPKSFEELRAFWQDIFQDPEEFVDFYFDKVLSENRVILARSDTDQSLVGMLHLHMYPVMIDGKRVKGCYIVKSGVLPEFRDHGIMHRMLEEATDIAREEGCAIIYGATDHEEDMERLGFFTAGEYVELDIDIMMIEEDNGVPDDLSGEEGYYTVRFRDLTDEQLSCLAEEADEGLAKKYAAYVLRNGASLASMRDEHLCQSGGVMAVYESGMSMDEAKSERLAGIFAYDIYDDTLYVHRFENFDYNVRYTLDTVVRFAEEAACRRCVVRMPAAEMCDDVYNLLGTTARLEEAQGIVAKCLTDTASSDEEKIKRKCFFDEIV